MKSLSLLNSSALALVLTVALSACADEITSPGMDDVPLTAAFGANGNGNGAPTGYHFTLNIHGVENNGQGIGNGNGTHNMWVALWGNTKINLYEENFGVIDADGRDGTASFGLPNPDADGDGETVYSVFARGMGQGSATIVLCAETDTGDLVCNNGEVTLGAGKKKFENVSKELLFLWDVDLDGDGVVDLKRVGLFDAALQGYFWDYTNSGLRLAQLRFYPCSTDVGDDYTDPINDSACFD